MTATTGSMHQGLRKAAAVVAALAAGYVLSISPLVGVAEAVIDQDVRVADDLHRLQHQAVGPLGDHTYESHDHPAAARHFWADPTHLLTTGTLAGHGH